MSSEYREREFLGNYLRMDGMNLDHLYQEWSRCDPANFMPIANKMAGMRCLN